MLLESEHFSRGVGTRMTDSASGQLATFLANSDYDEVIVSEVCWLIDSEALFICCWFCGIVG
jgi:hypothetical protein